MKTEIRNIVTRNCTVVFYEIEQLASVRFEAPNTVSAKTRAEVGGSGRTAESVYEALLNQITKLTRATARDEQVMPSRHEKNLEDFIYIMHFYIYIIHFIFMLPQHLKNYYFPCVERGRQARHINHVIIQGGTKRQGEFQGETKEFSCM